MRRQQEPVHAANRREFLLRAAAAIPAMHAGGFVAAGMTTDGDSMIDDPPASAPAPAFAATTARFARLRMRSRPLDEMASFYRDVLRLPVNASADRLEVTTGDTVLEFAPPAPDGAEPFYHFAFNIPHNKLDAAIRWMDGKAPLVRRESGEVIFHFPNWDAHAIYFLDPSGNIVEFIARHTLRNDAPGEFGVADILCASEIGVVTPDVKAASDAIGRAAGVAPYRPVGVEFAAIGDEHGLFIVVRQGRRWFTSDRKAVIFDAEAAVRSEAAVQPADFAAEKFRIGGA